MAETEALIPEMVVTLEETNCDGSSLFNETSDYDYEDYNSLSDNVDLVIGDRHVFDFGLGSELPRVPREIYSASSGCLSDDDFLNSPVPSPTEEYFQKGFEICGSSSLSKNWENALDVIDKNNDKIGGSKEINLEGTVDGLLEIAHTESNEGSVKEEAELNALGIDGNANDRQSKEILRRFVSLTSKNLFRNLPRSHDKRKIYQLCTADNLLGCFTLKRTLKFFDEMKFKNVKWEMLSIALHSDGLKAIKATGYMETFIPYSSVEDVHIISRWDAGQKFCIRVSIQDGSLLLQANNSHLRDQWLYSIQWKKHMYKYEKLLTNARRPEVLVKEIKNMIDVSLHTPIQDPSVYQFPLDLVSELLQRNADVITKVAHENIIVALAPLLENNHPTQEICDFFSKHCKNSPRSSIVIELFTPVVQRILKHNMDFGKFPRMRQFVQEYIQALNCQNAGLEVVKDFIRSMHGPASMCPHPRVLPNLVAVCLAAVYSLYEDKKLDKQDNICSNVVDQSEWERKVICYVGMMETMSLFEDWRYILGSLLQPIPFPNDALADDLFTSNMKNVIRNIAVDKVCDVHQTILGIREGKEGWFHLYCPGNIGCDDDGELWGQMLQTLMHCCCKRKSFLFGLNKMIGPVMLLSLRENTAAMEVLCAMLECDVVENNDLKMQMVTTLQSTTSGKRMYAELCERQIALRELQQKGGPKKLTLPSKSTDADLAKMLSSGSFGNLECLSLAFTQVTSACADDLIKLPSLRYLNLWSTQFGDIGLQKISEHLHKLQVLNLCETPVTDKGLSSIAALKNLRKLNLNSTNLSALVFEGLKEKLPALHECDVRYTDAW